MTVFSRENMMRLKGNTMISWRMLLLGFALCMIAACTAGPAPNAEKFAGLPEEGAASGFSYFDKDFTLAPNDVVGVTYLTSIKPTTEYALQVGDVLLVEFHQQEHLNRNIVIRPDGQATFPFIGDVKAAEITVNSLNNKVSNLYKNKRIFDSVSITISVTAFNSRLRELQAAMSNSLYGQTRETIISNDGYLELPYAGRLFAAGKALPDIQMEINSAYAGILPGVNVTIELKQMRANYIYVLGEVNNPGIINIMGPMGVAQAVAAAGGFKPTSDLTSVVVLRSGKGSGPAGRIVDVDHILGTGDLSQDVPIRRFDVVYVPPTMIKKLNDAVLLYVRNLLPINTQANVGFSYMWGSTTGDPFDPF